MDTARPGQELGRFWASVTGCSYVKPSTPDDSGRRGRPGRGGGWRGWASRSAGCPRRRASSTGCTSTGSPARWTRCSPLGARRRPGLRGPRRRTGRCCWTGGRRALRVRPRTRRRAYQRLRGGRWTAADPERLGALVGRACSGYEARERGPAASGGPEGVPGHAVRVGCVFDPGRRSRSRSRTGIHWDVYGDVDELVAQGAARPCWDRAPGLGRCSRTRRATSSACYCTPRPEVVSRSCALRSQPRGSGRGPPGQARPPTFGQPRRPTVSGVTSI